MWHKSICVKVLFIFILSVLTGNCFFNIYCVSGNIIYVDDDGARDYSTIQAAINKAKDNDTIYVFNGTYIENIAIDKSINLIGEDKNKTIIDGGEQVSVIQILCNNVNVNGFTLKNATIGVFISGSANLHNNTIEGNIIVNNTNGVYLQNSSITNTISNNIIKYNSEGILLYNSSKNLIMNNYILNHNIYGLSLWETSNENLIMNNIIIENRIGIHLGRWSNNNNISWNNITSNSWFGVHLVYSFNNIIYNNYFSTQDEGIYLSHSKDNNITHNIFIDNKNSAIYLSNSDDNFISDDNVFLNNGEDIQIKSKPPGIKVPSFEVIVMIIIIFALLMIFFFKQKKNK
jgi:parallel beta-helix repeat protein